MALPRSVMKDFPVKDTPVYVEMRFGKWPDELPKYEAALAELHQTHSTISRSWPIIWNHHRAAMRDETATPAARMLRSADFAEKTIKTVEARIEAARAKAQDRLKELGEHLQAQLYPPAVAGRATQDQEIRAYFARLPGEEKISRANAAMNSGDETTVRALVTAPAYLSGLNDKTHERLKVGYLQRVAPEALQLGRQIQQGLELVNGAAAALLTDTSAEIDFATVEQIRKAAQL